MTLIDVEASKLSNQPVNHILVQLFSSFFLIFLVYFKRQSRQSQSLVKSLAIKEKTWQGTYRAY